MADVDELTAGRLLVATPLLVDPNFLRTVVLLLDVDESGALGVVLNRPSPVPVHSVLPDWAERVPQPDVIFAGGPVATDSALAVAYLGGGEGEEPVGFRTVFGNTGIIDLDTPAELLTDVVGGVRVFAGYAGWGPDQLQGEVAEGSWFVVDSLFRDVFGGDPDRLWAEVLRRQPGELAWLSTMPVDPNVN
ncbi:MAG TPA: YqgE/AlgH family protein [Nocardioidaceae bacterium]|nr:YqgE/AlgH family protein [Nocardioidaceae bacterium]